MKRRLLIFSSLITLLLSCFSFPIFAEETVQDSSTLHTLGDGVFLDQYFYDNYDPLPYLQSTGSQYINTGTMASSDYSYNIVFSDISPNSSSGVFLFGSGGSAPDIYDAISIQVANHSYFSFGSGNYTYPYFLSVPYSLYDITMNQSIYLNGQLIHTFPEQSFESSINTYLFTRLLRNGGTSPLGSFKLYKFTIYDQEADEYVRYYYPAKAKTSGAIGLYDAVSKTFIVSSSNTQFANPTNEYVENFQISSFLTNSLTWIGQIYTAIIDMPIVIVFMAIGLAGAMFRWGRRIVHF